MATDLQKWMGKLIKNKKLIPVFCVWRIKYFLYRTIWQIGKEAVFILFLWKILWLQKIHQNKRCQEWYSQFFFVFGMLNKKTQSICEQWICQREKSNIGVEKKVITQACDDDRDWEDWELKWEGKKQRQNRQWDFVWLECLAHRIAHKTHKAFDSYKKNIER